MEENPPQLDASINYLWYASLINPKLQRENCLGPDEELPHNFQELWVAAATSIEHQCNWGNGDRRWNRSRYPHWVQIEKGYHDFYF
jgi:hypothetical protein